MLYFCLLMLFIFCIGAVIGSFLNVVILRAFSGESIVLPPSKCPKCQNRLKWWHNIPILSYLLLRGKCYFCHEKISIQYPIIEFITGLAFILVFLKFGFSIETIFGFIVASLLIVISVTDIKERVVFDAHTYALIGTGLVYAVYLTVMQIVNVNASSTTFRITGEWILHNPVTMAVAGIILGAVVMECAARAGYLLAGTRAFGEGDSYIAAGLGAVFGWKNLLVILVLSVVVQLIFTLPVFLKKLFLNKDWKTLVPLTLFFIYAAGYYFLQKTSLFNSGFILLAAIALMLILGVWACVNIIRGLKNPDGMTYLPFGPALAIAGMIILLL